MSESITARLMVLAGRKQHVNKYTNDVENAYDELLVQFVEGGKYSKKDKALRLMLRIKQALISEGFDFRPGPASLGSSAPGPDPSTGVSNNLLCVGGLCTLLKTRPPKGLDIEATVRLMELIGGKQCYRFVLKPKKRDTIRSTGINVGLPKPVTWAKLDHYGVDRQNVQTSDGRILMEAFRVDGISAYTLDRQTFYTSNAEKCRRWAEGLDRMVSQLLVNR